MPEMPMTCCMSGCANCVWINYAVELTEYMKDGGEKAKKEIEEKVEDHSLKVFLKMQVNEEIEKNKSSENQ